jgi:hypothetical protein
MNRKERAYFGDLHNYRNVSYAHGDPGDAIRNARQRLDSCSVAGHAHWADIPKPTERTQHVIDVYIRGFEKLKKKWPVSLETRKAAFEPGRFVTVPGFEVHSSADGARAVMYREPAGYLLYPDRIPDLEERINELKVHGQPALSLPHHIGYHQGAGGITRDHFNPETSLVVEVYSMHGASESTEGLTLRLEVGWGLRGREAPWDVDFDISVGEILEVAPRFRSPGVPSPPGPKRGGVSLEPNHRRSPPQPGAGELHLPPGEAEE